MKFVSAANFCPVEQGFHGADGHLLHRRAHLLDFRLGRAAGVEHPQERAEGGPRGAARDAASAQQALRRKFLTKENNHKPQGLLPIFAFYHHNLSNLFVNYTR